MYAKQLSKNFVSTSVPSVNFKEPISSVQTREQSVYVDSNKIRSALESTIVGAINSTANAAVETTKKYIWQTFGSETNLIAAIVSICTTIVGFLSLLIAGLTKFWKKIKDCSCCRSILHNYTRRFATDVELGGNQVDSAPLVQVSVDNKVNPACNEINLTPARQVVANQVNPVHNGRSFVNYEHEGEFFGTPVSNGNDLSMNNLSLEQS